MFCTRCGQQNPSDARFCARCGAELVRPGEPVGGAEAPGEVTTTLSLSALQAAGVAPSEAEEGLEGGDAELPAESLPPGSALLVVKRGPNAGSRFLLDQAVTTAGRHPESDIFLDDVTVSRRHAEFRREGALGEQPVFRVRDVGSLNGTYVNRERIDDVELAGGDEVQIGKFRLVFLLGARAGDGGAGGAASAAGGGAA